MKNRSRNIVNFSQKILSRRCPDGSLCPFINFRPVGIYLMDPIPHHRIPVTK